MLHELFIACSRFTEIGFNICLCSGALSMFCSIDLSFLLSTSSFLLTNYYEKHINLFKSHLPFKTLQGPIYSINYCSGSLPIYSQSSGHNHPLSLHFIRSHSFHNTHQNSLTKVNFELLIANLNGHLPGFI